MTSFNKAENDPKAIEIVSEFKKLSDERVSLDAEWQNIAEYIIPHKANITRKSSRPSELESKLYDTTGIDSLLTAAAGLMNWTTPKSMQWFSFEPTRKYKHNTAIRKWLAECTSLGNEYLANSNFYTQRHESLIDKLAFGTSAMFSQVSDKGETYFENLEVASYVIKENFMGIVDTVLRKIELTAKQAAQQFGEDMLPKCVIEDLQNNHTRKHDYIHICKPREAHNVSTNAIKPTTEKPFASIYIHEATKTIVKESGYDTFPFHVGRWLSWNGIYKGWGYGPGFSVLPEVRQVNYYQKMLDIYAGKVVFPPMLVPDTFEGTLDTSSKAINYYKDNSGGPEAFRQLEVTGNMQIGLERLDTRRKAIHSKFFTDLWQMLATREHQKTATEVIELVNEKLDALSPAFDKDVSEVIEPMLQRMFNLWGINGMLPPPPEEAIELVQNGYASVPNPVITMSGKLALAIKQLKNTTSDRQLQRLMAMSQANPAILDIWNFDAWAKDSSFNAGVDAAYIRDDEEVKQIRDQRAQAQQAQQQQQMMLAAGKVIGPDNIKNLAQNMPELAKQMGQ